MVFYQLERVWGFCKAESLQKTKFEFCVVIFFLVLEAHIFFSISLVDYFFSLLEPHSELQRTWLYRKFRKSNLYFFYVKVMKKIPLFFARSHFFLQTSFFGTRSPRKLFSDDFRVTPPYKSYKQKIRGRSFFRPIQNRRGHVDSFSRTRYLFPC